MKRFGRLLAAVLVVSIQHGRADAAKVRLVATVPDLAAIASAVGGSRVEVTSLSTPNQDPHFVDARPHLMLSLNRADLLVVVGLDLEIGWLPTLLAGARNGEIQPGNDGYLDASTAVELRQVPKGRIDRSMGDIHPGGNPHYLLAPGSAKRVAQAIAARLATIDADGDAFYEKQVERFVAKVATGKRRWRKALAPYRGTKVVAFHQAWTYFAEAMGLSLIGYLEPKPGIPPSSAHLLALIKRMRADKVPLILCNSYYPDRATQLVARKTGAAIVRAAGGADIASGESYVARMDRLVSAVVGALKGKK